MNVYYYLYYRIYRLAERTSMPWWSDFKAGFLIAAIEMALLALAEYKMTLLLSIQGADIFGKWGYILIIGGPPLVFNYFLFLYRNRWKEIVYRFDEADKQEKSKMNFQLVIMLLLVASLFIMLMRL